MTHPQLEAYGYLSPVTVNSERCQLQRVRVAMLAKAPVAPVAPVA